MPIHIQIFVYIYVYMYIIIHTHCFSCVHLSEPRMRVYAMDTLPAQILQHVLVEECCLNCKQSPHALEGTFLNNSRAAQDLGTHALDITPRPLTAPRRLPPAQRPSARPLRPAPRRERRCGCLKFRPICEGAIHTRWVQGLTYILHTSVQNEGPRLHFKAQVYTIKLD